jgi:hypothetical protein
MSSSSPRLRLAHLKAPSQLSIRCAARPASLSCSRFELGNSCERLPRKLVTPAAKSPPRLEFACELRDNIPAFAWGRPTERYSQKVFNRSRSRNFAWPKGNRLTRTYVDSRKVLLTRVHRESSRIRRFCRIRFPTRGLVTAMLAGPNQFIRSTRRWKATAASLPVRLH